MSNIGARYEIIGRIPQGTAIVGYMLRDKMTNTVGQMEKAMVEQLALNKQIYNCTAQIYGNIVNLKGINCKLSQLPKYDMNGNLIVDDNKQKRKVVADLKLIGKIQHGRTISNYIVISINEPDKKLKIPRDMVIKLAQEGRIVNAKSQMNGDEAMLRGVSGVNLAQLTTYQV